ncbi:MAG: hypothetical protein GYA17_11925 [Chloroflexi bacterium]|nr:hypothetical protein [Chloroflexota bacterium]
MTKIKYFIILIIPFIALINPTHVSASPREAVCEATQDYSWKNASTQHFSVLYTEEYAVLNTMLTAGSHGRLLDAEYERFNALFEETLPQPVSIRIYPDPQTYACLNSVAGEVSLNLSHTSSGSREIALIGNNILANMPFWAEHSLNMIRYDLGSLFVKQASANAAPPGLVSAVGHYLQEPAVTMATLDLNQSDWQAPGSDWRQLWEDPDTAQDIGKQLQATSAVAYVVKNYGWDPFLSFLQRLPAAPDFSQALADTYGVRFTELEAGWRTYYPLYFRGDWQSNPLYDYDLSAYTQLIRMERYREAGLGLQEAIRFLEAVHNEGSLLQARGLLQVATQGLQGDTLYVQSQQAFQSGDYLAALGYLNQAELFYGQTPNRVYHLDEFTTYRNQIIEVIALHAELERLQTLANSPWNAVWYSRRLIALGQRLGSLGDVQGYQEALALAELAEAQLLRAYTYLTAGILVVVTGLLGYLWVWMRRTPPPEAQL